MATNYHEHEFQAPQPAVQGSLGQVLHSHHLVFASALLSLRVPVEVLPILFASQWLHKAFQATPHPPSNHHLCPGKSLRAPHTMYLVFGLLMVISHTSSPPHFPHPATKPLFPEKQGPCLTNIYSLQCPECEQSRLL